MRGFPAVGVMGYCDHDVSMAQSRAEVRSGGRLRLVSRLAELRTARGWTQQELADHADVSRRAIQGWEDVDIPRPIYQDRLAKVLKVTVAELGFGDQPMV